MEKYFVFSEEDKKSVRSLFDVSEEEVLKKVHILKEWVKTRPDLPLESANETFLNLMLLRGKFKEDVVRKNIENYFKYICRYPEFFSGLDKLKPCEEVGIAVALPKVTDSWERIVLLKLSPENLLKNEVDMTRCVAIGIAMAMIILNNDYAASVRLIVDYDHCTLNHIRQLNINYWLKVNSIHENVLKMRISGIELINAPHVLSVLLNMAKMILNPKLFSRVTCHNDLSSLYENVPKKYLPRDYGGDEESVENLIKLWDKTYRNHKEFFERVEEIAGQGAKDDKDDIFGVQGSFKSLEID